MEAIRNLFQEVSGASAVEYGLMIALVLLAIIYTVDTLVSILGTIGTTISNMWGSNPISTAS